MDPLEREAYVFRAELAEQTDRYEGKLVSAASLTDQSIAPVLLQHYCNLASLNILSSDRSEFHYSHLYLFSLFPATNVVAASSTRA